MARMTECKVCSKEIASNAKSCPECGAKNKKTIYKRFWFIILVLFLIIGVIGTVTSDEDSITANNNITESEDKTSDNESTNSTLMAEETKEDTTTEEKIATEYESALKKAKHYVVNLYMSKARVYEQLISEQGDKFTPEAAQYAIDNVDANWNKNALKIAQAHADNMYNSKARIYDHLVDEYGEKFTAEEAQYAIDNVVANWKENALETAKRYKKNTSLTTKDVIYNQLISKTGEKFTAEEAQYAIDNLK